MANELKSQKPDNPGNGNPNNGDKKISLIIIVNGEDVTIDANPKQKLKVVAEKALQETGNTGRDLDQWDLKTKDGILLDFNNTVESYGLTDGSQLFLSLKAGAGGDE